MATRTLMTHEDKVRYISCALRRQNVNTSGVDTYFGSLLFQKTKNVHPAASMRAIASALERSPATGAASLSALGAALSRRPDILVILTALATR
jgi:hypothetical protein